MPAAEDLLSQLNPAQREAVEIVDGPLLIIAGAGSGKTRVITFRIAHMLRHCGVRPWNLLAVTFTNKAAGEMRRRVVELIGEDPGPSLQVSTFHSACARLLRREAYKVGLSPNFTICDESDQVAVIKDCLKALDLAKDEIQPSLVQRVISECKMRLLGPEDYAPTAETETEHHVADVFRLYQKRLRENDAVDFDDLLGYVVKLFEDSPPTLAEYQQRFRYVLVDEYQDTNNVQYRLVESLAREHRNLCVVGDEDQCIYSWRGAEIDNLLDFQKHFPEAKLVRLEQNYRSTQAILSVADISIANNKERLGKTLWTARAAGDKPVAMIGETAHDEARLVVDRILYHYANGCRFGDMAIFYRANWLSRAFEDQLRACNVPYRVVGGIRFYDRAEIKDLLAYLQLIENPDNSIQLLRVLNRPRRGIGDKSIESLMRLADQRGVSCYRAIAIGVEEKAFSAGLAAKLTEFHAMIESWRAQRKKEPSVADLLQLVLKDTQYLEKLGDPKDFEVINRRENIAELAASIDEWAETSRSGALTDYLEMVSLQSATDDKERGDCVPLMTLHCAKGLEFKVVFLVALEEPILPNSRAVDERGNLEEERRLFYVGLTRAQDHVYLTRATSRRRFRDVMYNKVSRFLLEIPPEMLEEHWGEPANTAGASRDGGWRRSGWGGGEWSGGSSRGRMAPRRPVERQSVFDRPSGRPSQFADPNGGRVSRPADPNGGRVFQPANDVGHESRRTGKSALRSGRANYAVGQRVRHAIFGDGAVTALDKAAGGRAMVIVEFADGQSRAFVAEFAGLKPIQ